MSENPISHSDPSGSITPVGVDLLGQFGSSSQDFDPRDFSNRSLLFNSHSPPISFTAGGTTAVNKPEYRGGGR